MQCGEGFQYEDLVDRDAFKLRLGDFLDDDSIHCFSAQLGSDEAANRNGPFRLVGQQLGEVLDKGVIVVHGFLNHVNCTLFSFSLPAYENMYTLFE